MDNTLPELVNDALTKLDVTEEAIDIDGIMEWLIRCDSELMKHGYRIDLYHQDENWFKKTLKDFDDSFLSIGLDIIENDNGDTSEYVFEVKIHSSEESNKFYVDGLVHYVWEGLYDDDDFLDDALDYDEIEF